MLLLYFYFSPIHKILKKALFVLLILFGGKKHLHIKRIDKCEYRI